MNRRSKARNDRATPMAQQAGEGGEGSAANGGATLRGSCHCGRIGLAFSIAQAPATLHPRACDCSFCTRHGAAWVSDPAGRLSMSVRGADTLGEYRQGSSTARFLLCRHCGVLVAVVADHAARLHGAVNARCLDGDTRLGDRQPASPQRLAPEQRRLRWSKLWVPDVVLAISDA